MVVIIVLSVALFITVSFLGMIKLDQFLEKNIADHFDTKINIAFENPTVADSFCQELERFSSCHPNVEFSFFTGNLEEIERAIDMGQISFGIVSEPVRRNYRTIPIALKSGKLTLPFHSVSVEPFSENVLHFLVIFCDDEFDSMKMKVVDLFSEISKS